MKRSIAITAAALLAMGAAPAQAQDRYLGEIFMFGGNFCPRNTLPAEGQLLAIARNTALFSLFGTYYGGDGRTTFALPDLRGRAPAGQGQGPGLRNRGQGEKYGADSAVYGSEKATPDADAPVVGTPTIAMRYCVVTNGIYPSRS